MSCSTQHHQQMHMNRLCLS